MILKRIHILLMIAVIIATAVSLEAQFGKNKVQVDKIDWAVIETLHFDIYYPKGADEFGKKVALMSEEAYYFLQDAFQVPMYERVPLIFYESHREFQVTNIIYPLLTEAVGGFTESLRNRIAIPYDGSYKKLEETLIHELTHAYVNQISSDMRSSMFFNVQQMPFPFWFDEGLPEYFAIGGDDNYNNMFVMDMVINSNLRPLDRVGGFAAYRLGESFLTYIDEVYGPEAVMQLFYSTKTSGSMDSASQRVFGMNFEAIQKRWRNYLLRKYTPYLSTYDIPYEVYQKRTDHEKQNSYYNYAPRFSPDGSRYLYYSNRNQRTSIFRGLTIDIFEDERILKGETKGKFEQFHFLRSNISWFPDSRHFAFVAKTESGDVIYIMDVQEKEITEKIQMFDFDAIYEIDICSKGNRVVFSGQKAMNNNIYYMDLDSREVTQITDDAYYDHQPRWSNDRSKIVFASERGRREESKHEHIFNRLTDQIFYYDIESDRFYQLTDDQYSNHSPFWNREGSKVLFVSEQDKIANYHVIDLEKNARARVTNTINGVFKGDMDAEETLLVFPVFYEDGWDIYMHRNPLQDLDYYPYQQPQAVNLQDDYFERFDLNRYRYYGRDDDLLANDDDDERVIERHDRSFYRVRKTNTLHPRPAEINEPYSRPYRVRFFLDRLWGGLAYSSAYGTIGNLQLGFSDMMGDHTMGIQLGITESFKDSDLIFSYLYLPRRIDHGFGFFYLNDDYIRYYRDFDVYIKTLERDVGVFTLTSYPFNRFWRLDFENVLYNRNEEYEGWDSAAGTWIELGSLERWVYSPQLKFVHDNILYGPTGPMSGWRGLAGFSYIFAEKSEDFYVARADLRNYTLFAKKYSFATRLLLGRTDAETEGNRFRLDRYNGVRALTDSSIRGQNKAVATMELRFPFIDRLDMQFPLPMTIGNIRGSFYTDIGAVWSEDASFRGMKDGRLKDIHMGIGMGPRINLGYFVLKFDTTWKTDLSSSGRPSFWWSINQEF